MRKLVKTGLVIPTILLVALAAVGMSMAADNGGDGTSRVDKQIGARSARGSGAVEAATIASRGDDDRVSSEGVRPERRGRQALRAIDPGSVIDEAAWYAWSTGRGGRGDGDEDEDEDEDEDDDEDQSPSNP